MSRLALIESNLLGCQDGRDRSIIKCTWSLRHSLVDRIFFGMSKSETIEAIYVGSGTVWRLLETYQRVHVELEARLADIEAKLLRQAERQKAYE